MILELQNITLNFSGSKDSFRILDGLNFSVEKGRITALIGGNGSGKTTLFNIISGFQEGFTGNILFNGKPLHALSPAKIAQRGIGRLFQGKPLFQDLNLLDNMKLASGDSSGESPFSYLINRKKIDAGEQEKERQAIDILNSLFGADNKYTKMLHNMGSEFSYGEQRLISLARLFMGNYSLLLLDEPTAGVNPVYINTIRQIILRMIADGKTTVLLIEHNMPFVRDIADRCAYLADGRIQHQGTPCEVLDNREVKNSYLGIL
ncbi:MAG: ATP-binding cassette domain-containing protein [Prevotellaceae bacterium]|jgi:ABC-type branched-subunit amino acid transport system ATPase component|nr:ATP-binding cassette domain-containing protein [Prevotellaceae bacterium]